MQMYSQGLASNLLICQQAIKTNIMIPKPAIIVLPLIMRRNEVWNVKVFETERLNVRWLDVYDSEFILQLLNEPGWLKFIGDKGIRSIEDAENYIVAGPRSMYEQYGFGLFVAEVKETHVPIGLCGLIKRDGLEDVDLGFAFLEAHQLRGYAYEAAKGTLEYACKLGIGRIVAITTKDNIASSTLLEKLGMELEGYVTLPNDIEKLRLYGVSLLE